MDTGEVDIANNPPIGKSINANVYYDGSFFYHLWDDQSWFASCDNQNVGQNGVLGEISCFSMADGDGCFLLEQHQGHWFTDDIARSDHNHIFACDIGSCRFEQ